MSEPFDKLLEALCEMCCIMPEEGFLTTVYTASHTITLKKMFWVKKERLAPKYLEDEYTF